LLERLAADKWSVLERARNRAAWEKVAQDKEARKRAEKEEEAVAFGQIDWDDFAVVQTIEFTSTDQSIDLPPPTTVQAMQMLNLNERRMAAMIVEENVQRGQDESAPAEEQADQEMAQVESEDEETREQRLREQEELDRARAIQAKALGQAGMKIRKDYVPRTRRNANVATSICPYCKQAIPETEISEHIRIELLDPKWKEQKQLLDQKKTQAAQLLQNADVSASLKQLASARTDLFGTAEDEERRKKQEAEERAARKAKESIVYDGHLASKTRTQDAFQQKYSLEDQIQNIRERAGLAA
jgi:splicing factor 3A subunit 1